MFELSLLLLLFVSAIAVLLGLLQIRFRRLPTLQGRVRQQVALASEIKLLEEVERQIEQAQKIAERAVSSGSKFVRGVHTGIAAIPFSILEELPSTRETARQVRVSHDQISAAVYDGIELINRKAHGGLREFLKTGENPMKARRRSHPDAGKTSPKNRGRNLQDQ